MSEQKALPTKTFTRGTIHSVFRWVAFLAMMALDVACVAATIEHAMAAPSVQYFMKQIVGYFLLFVCNAAVLPSIILEARKVEIFDDHMVIHNLLYRTSVSWSDIRKVIAPVYLKFAIVKTPRWFVLINKRDVERFSDLIQIIRDKAESPAKS